MLFVPNPPSPSTTSSTYPKREHTTARPTLLYPTNHDPSSHPPSIHLTTPPPPKPLPSLSSQPRTRTLPRLARSFKRPVRQPPHDVHVRRLDRHARHIMPPAHHVRDCGVVVRELHLEHVGGQLVVELV